MLIITRRIGERLVIGDNAFCTILGVKGNQVRIGIDAPADIQVHREEIFLKIKAEKEVLKAVGTELDNNLVDPFWSHQQKNNSVSRTH